MNSFILPQKRHIGQLPSELTGVFFLSVFCNAPFFVFQILRTVLANGDVRAITTSHVDRKENVMASIKQLGEKNITSIISFIRKHYLR